MLPVSCKFVLLGDSGVGKTCLVRRLTNQEFDDYTNMTVGVDYTPHKMEFDDRPLKMQIWDIGGQDVLRESISKFYSGATCAIVVFDLCDRSTFLRLNNWLGTLKEYVRNPALVTILCGNKVDLADNQYVSVVAHGRGISPTKMRTREVSNAEAERFAEANSLTYFETSAKTGTNVINAFESAGRRVVEQLWDGEYDVRGDTELHGVRFIDGPGAPPTQGFSCNPLLCCLQTTPGSYKVC